MNGGVVNVPRDQHRLHGAKPAPRPSAHLPLLCPLALTASLLPRPRPRPQRKRLEPFEVPKSGAFWLHDDRYDPGEGEGGAAAGREAEGEGEELDERQK